MGARKKLLLILSILMLFNMISCEKKMEEDVASSKLSSSWAELSPIDHSEKGYYIASYSLEQILFYDTASKKTVPLCSKPECEHNRRDPNCNAYLAELFNSSIQYYNGFLYAVTASKSGEIALYKIEHDGSHHEKVATLYVTTGDAMNTINHFKVYGDYVYFLLWNLGDDGSLSNHLYRKKLDGSEKEELVYANTQDNLSSSSLGTTQVYDGKIYFIDTYYFKDDFNDIKGEVYCYDPSTKKLEKILENAYGDFFILEDELYYQNNEEPIRKYNFSTKEVTDFAPLEENNTWLWISSDGNYIYTDNFFDSELEYDEEYEKRCILVYSLDGKLIDRIPLKGFSGRVLFGDEYNVVYQDGGSTYRFDKHQIGTGKYEWVEMKINDTESFQ